MTAVEIDDDSFIGLDHAEPRFPAAAVAAGQRAVRVGLFCFVGGIELVWFAIFVYLAYLFISS
jgi:hypothetical protein